MTVMLEVAIGLVFVYLVLSLLASALAEALEHFLRYRADYLQQGIEKLLLGGSVKLRKQLYQHPVVKSLFTPSRLESVGRAPGPTYIPSRQFALALLDMVTAKSAAPAPAGGAPPVAPADPPSPVDELRNAIDTSTDLPESLVRALRTLIDDAGDDLEKVKANIQQWFDGSMDAVAGWYKRRAQFLLLAIGIIVVVVVNADTLSIINTLSNDSAVRAAVVTAAESHIERSSTPPQGGNQQSAPAPVEPGKPSGAGARSSPRNAADRPLPASLTQSSPGQGAPPAETNQQSETASAQTPVPADQLAAQVKEGVQATVDQLGSLGLPVGWRWFNEDADLKAVQGKTPEQTTRYLVANRVLPRTRDEAMSHAGTHLLGWLLTAIAVSFGAPFWFDTLNKIMVVRSTVKPREKSPEEGSEDRQPSRGSQTVRIEVAAAK